MTTKEDYKKILQNYNIKNYFLIHGVSITSIRHPGRISTLEISDLW